MIDRKIILMWKWELAMRLVSTATVEPGAILAKTIYNDKGQVLLSDGVALNERMLKRLLEMGIAYVYIKDAKTEDIQYKEAFPRELKVKAIKSIESTFHQIQVDATLSRSFVVERASQNFTDIIRQLHEEIKNNGDLLSILSDVFTYDDYIFTHSFNVTLYSLAIGMELGLPQKEIETLGLGAIMHDVGKMKIPTDILLKPGRLTDEEFQIVKQHPEDGFRLLKDVHTISLLVAHCAYQHHERINGSGYPRGIKGNEIHRFGKIIAVADVFDAVTSNRVYRKAMLPHDGLEILFAGSGTLFEEEIVNAFRKAVAIYPVGITVELSDGRKGIVSEQNSGKSDRPKVKILEKDGLNVTPYELDLMKELSVVITGCDTTFSK